MNKILKGVIRDRNLLREGSWLEVAWWFGSFGKVPEASAVDDWEQKCMTHLCPFNDVEAGGWKQYYNISVITKCGTDQLVSESEQNVPR